MHDLPELAEAPELPELVGKHVVFLSWRDTRNPEGGGAERYLEKMAAGLVARGCTVTVFCAAHAAAAPEEVVDGIRFVRRGSKLSVYLAGMRALRRGDLGRPDVVVDVQNGLPFFSRLVTRAPVVVLVHHVHREQWPVVYPGLSGRVGWWIERRFAPWLYRHCQYVAVSRATRGELRQLGVRGPRIAVVHNGTDPYVAVDPGPSPTPLVAVVGRLVPHKQVEHAVDAVLALRAELPDLELVVVGGGWWDAQLREHVCAVGAEDVVTFEGHVEEERKHEVYERAWVLALPSLKEGWGLVIGEAGMHSTPSVAYASAGGTRESIEDGVSGLLVDTQDELTETLGRLLRDDDLRARLGAGALAKSHAFTWETAQQAFALVLLASLHGRLVDSQDPEDVQDIDA
ncbi:glycosyl hydrolase [Nocardioides psychrotolerans]|uniref:Glycosyltransferase involved in cell wall bisynthesis n=1 Tax=Nocardioides psychrotolerans TaxID=1005945 RepID=A0A1I3FMN7_9ACTN|nr:glycosyltransferase family 4 protein [Nocardioides psychrotolerans]GEP37214.1 glycosyl hydrolase [Nocardioides psychrotolerans]SFI12426.1 Glycosyltransferase involved in cell wall bisynthesis [Nocardioides psychrotolerans]